MILSGVKAECVGDIAVVTNADARHHSDVEICKLTMSYRIPTKAYKKPGISGICGV
jgi:hypothetical protein